MSLINPITSPTSSSSSGQPVTTPLEIALSKFASTLTDRERRDFQDQQAVPDSSAVLVFTATLDQLNASRRGKSIGSRAYFLLLSIQKFSSIVETFVSSNPSIAALVWGSLKLTILIAVNITSYFESLSEILMDLNRLCPKFDEYELLYPDSPALQRSICEFHASIVDFCREAILLTRQSWSRVLASSLRGKLQPFIAAVKGRSNEVKDTITLTKATYDRKAQDLHKKSSKLIIKQGEQLMNLSLKIRKGIEFSQEWQIQREESLMRERRERLLDSLSTYAFQFNFHQARKKRYMDTAMWLLKMPEFVAWRAEDQSSAFVLTGKLGSGKTLLATKVVDHLCIEENTDQKVLFLFPRFDDSDSLKASTVLRSLIRQILEFTHVLPKDIEVLLEIVEKPFQDLEKLEELFKYCVSFPFTYYAVIDSMEEFDQQERDTICGVFSRAISLKAKLKLFLVGRESILKDARRWFPACHQVSVTPVLVQSDIDTYTAEVLAERWGEERMAYDKVLAEEIVEVLTKNANGMFLWVDYQIIEICKQTCNSDIHQVLGNLPEDLEETFDRALRRIVKLGPVKVATQIFLWTATTKRPLTVEEMEDALSYEPGQLYSIPDKRPINFLLNVITWCQNLVLIDNELETIQFPHRSVWEHLLRKRPEESLQAFYIHPDDADHFVGEICVTYLELNDFKMSVTRRPGFIPMQIIDHVTAETLEQDLSSRFLSKMYRIKTRHQQARSGTVEPQKLVQTNENELRNARLASNHPFLSYAKEYWLVHTREFHANSCTWNSWRKMIFQFHDLATTPWSQSSPEHKSFEAYNWALEYQHYPLLKQLISDGSKYGINHLPDRELICLCAQFEKTAGLEAVLSLQPSKEALNYGLISAFKCQNIPAVILLLNSGASIHEAYLLGDNCQEIPRLVMSRLQSEKSWYDLGRAEELADQCSNTFQDYLETFQLLLDRSASSTAPVVGKDNSALIESAGLGWVSSVRLLLSKEKFPSIPMKNLEGDNEKALQAAIDGYLYLILPFLKDLVSFEDFDQQHASPRFWSSSKTYNMELTVLVLGKLEKAHFEFMNISPGSQMRDFCENTDSSHVLSKVHAIAEIINIAKVAICGCYRWEMMSISSHSAKSKFLADLSTLKQRLEDPSWRAWIYSQIQC